VARGGRAKVRGEPERRCIVTRDSQPRRGLVRFVVGPDDAVVPDIGGRLPGRGIWVSAETAALRRAVEKGLFARGAKRPVRAAPDLPEQVEALLARHLVDLLAMARKAGQAVAGREKTLAALAAGEAALLVQAADGSAREKAALRPPAGDDTHVCCLMGHELGMAFGRDRVIHAAVLAGGLADRIRIESLRLSGVRDGIDRRQLGDDAGDEGVAGEGPRGKG
jgi:uncharacterized protein